MGLCVSALWEEREHLAVTAAEYLGLALVNLRLRTALQQQSIRDPLTALFNRRFMEETLTREIRRAQRKRTTLCVLMLDIDHFKLFNDRHGHAAGDIVLREFSALLADGIRGADVASRYGGEEFTILLLDTSADDALRKAEQLIARVRGLPSVSTASMSAPSARRSGSPHIPATASTRRTCCGRQMRRSTPRSRVDAIASKCPPAAWPSDSRDRRGGQLPAGASPFLSRSRTRSTSRWKTKSRSALPSGSVKLNWRPFGSRTRRFLAR